MFIISLLLTIILNIMVTIIKVITVIILKFIKSTVKSNLCGVSKNCIFNEKVNIWEYVGFCYNDRNKLLHYYYL